MTPDDDDDDGVVVVEDDDDDDDKGEAKTKPKEGPKQKSAPSAQQVLQMMRRRRQTASGSMPIVPDDKGHEEGEEGASTHTRSGTDEESDDMALAEKLQKRAETEQLREMLIRQRECYFILSIVFIALGLLIIAAWATLEF